MDGDLSLIEAADCKIWLKPSRGTNIDRVLPHCNLQIYEFPELEYFFADEPVPHYHYDRTWESGKRDPLWILHTSGSTGNPKPVRRYLDSAACSDANNLLPLIDGRRLLIHDYFESRVYITFPLFHVRCAVYPSLNYN